MDAFEVQALLFNHIAAGTLPRHLGAPMPQADFQPRGGQGFGPRQDRGQQYVPTSTPARDEGDRGQDGIERTEVPCDVCKRMVRIRTASLQDRRAKGLPITHRECRDGGSRPAFGARPGGNAPGAASTSTASVLDRLADDAAAKLAATGGEPAAS